MNANVNPKTIFTGDNLPIPVLCVYYYPRDKELAESKQKSIWECKVGMTESDVETRVRAKGQQRSMKNRNRIGTSGR